MVRLFDGIKPACQRCKRLKKNCTYNRALDAALAGKRGEAQKIKDLEARIEELETALAKTSMTPNIENSLRNINLSDLLQSLLQNNILSQMMSVQPSMSNTLQQFISPPQYISPKDPPFSTEIITDMLESYFNFSNWWPANFIHPNYFINKLQVVNPSLIYIVCARGCQYSKYDLMLKSMGVDPEEVLFESAKRNFDLEEMSFENMMTIAQMGLFCVSRGKLRQFWVYMNLTPHLVKYLQLYSDPDDLEQKYGFRWSVIEKEMRRRVWNLVSSVFLNSSHGSSLGSEVTVKSPLSLVYFHALTEEIIDFSSFQPQLSFFLASDFLDAEPIAQELMVFGYNVRNLYQRTLKEITNDILLEAEVLYQAMYIWFINTPDWFQNALKAEKINLKTTVQAGVPMLAIHLVLMFHSLVLLLFRINYSTLCRYPPETYPLGSKTSQSDNKNLQLCWHSQQIIINAFKTCRVFTEDNESFRIYPFNTGTLAQAAIFSCTMSRFADSREFREVANHDFNFLKRRIAKSGSFYEKMPELLLHDLNRIDELPFGEERERETHHVFAFGLQDLEKKVFAETFSKENKKRVSITRNSPLHKTAESQTPQVVPTFSPVNDESINTSSPQYFQNDKVVFTNDPVGLSKAPFQLNHFFSSNTPISTEVNFSSEFHSRDNSNDFAIANGNGIFSDEESKKLFDQLLEIALDNKKKKKQENEIIQLFLF
ncbi:hypothetical protein HK096_003799 [Nowakowskiella sp. JEL0078]|nr:hypothetical protein HK096_003799 [Nowakowskiella sp. JEL0078]